MTDNTKTFTMKDIAEGLNQTFMCMFHDLRSDCHGVNITTPTEVFGFLLDKDILNNKAGGILTNEKAKALRDFLNDYLKDTEKKQEENFKWYAIEDSVNSEKNLEYYEETQRARVPGGWLVKTVISYGTEGESEDWDRRCVSTVFVPDPNHEWNVEIL